MGGGGDEQIWFVSLVSNTVTRGAGTELTVIVLEPPGPTSVERAFRLTLMALVRSFIGAEKMDRGLVSVVLLFLEVAKIAGDLGRTSRYRKPPNYRQEIKKILRHPCTPVLCQEK